MGAGSVLATLGAALIGLAMPAEARHSSGGAVAGHFSGVTAGRFVPGRTGPGRIVIGSPRTHGNQIFLLDRFSGRVVARDRRAFPRSRRSMLFGFDGGFGGFGGFGGSIESPALVMIPQAVPEATQPARSQLAENLPLCHEMTPAGVVIERGRACSHAPR
jgi:hypothetical protein